MDRRYTYLTISLLILFVSHVLRVSIFLDIMVILNSYLLCRRYSNFKQLLLVSFVMGWCNYSCVMMQEGLLGRELTTFGQYNGTPIAFLGLEILYVHSLLMLFFTHPINNNSILKAKSYFEGYPKYPKSLYVKVFFTILTILIIVINVGFALLEHFGVEFISKTMFEYCIMLYILGLNLSRGNKFRWNIMLLLMILGILIDFSTRDRIIPLQMLMMMYAAHFQYKLKARQLIPMLIVGLVIMIFLGNNREEGALNSEAVGDSFSFFTQNRLTLDTAWAAYFCSLSELDFGKTLPFSEIWEFIKSYVAFLFLGSAYTLYDPRADLPTYIITEGYKHSYGNVSPLFFYFYLKWIGVILFSAIVSFYYKMSHKTDSAFARCLGLFFVASSFRWYLYGPSSILRGMMMFSILYFIFFKLILKYPKTNIITKAK